MELGLYLRSVTFTEKKRCIEAGTVFTFRPGLNLLVGDQGVGKSTLIEALRAHAKVKSPRLKSLPTILDVELLVSVVSRDFEKDNPRVQPGFGLVDGLSTGFIVQSMFMSHGQSVNLQIESLRKLDNPRTVLILDEPDSGLSLRSIVQMRDIFSELVSRGMQVIAAVHHPWLIESVSNVLSLEHRRWLPSGEFIVAMKVPKPSTQPVVPKTKVRRKVKVL